MAKGVPPKVSEPKLGITSTYEYFFEILKPNLDEYRRSPNIRAVLNAAWPLWHIHEWYYWERNPRQKGGNDDDCSAYGRKLTSTKDLLWIKNVAETAKHFSLTRGPVEVERIGRGSIGRFAIGVFNPIPRTVLQVEVDGRRYNIDALFERAFLFWLEKIMPHPVDLTLPGDGRANALSEGMLAWCRERLGDEQAAKQRWAYWGGDNPPSVARFSFYQRQDADDFRAHWEPLV